MRNSKSLREYLENETGLKAIKPDGIPSLEALAEKDALEHFDLTPADNKVALPSGNKLLDLIHSYYHTNPFSGKIILGILDENGNNTNRTFGEGKFTEYTYVTVFQNRIRITRNPINQDFRETQIERYFAI